LAEPSTVLSERIPLRRLVAWVDWCCSRRDVFRSQKSAIGAGLYLLGISQIIVAAMSLFFCSHVRILSAVSLGGFREPGGRTLEGRYQLVCRRMMAVEKVCGGTNFTAFG
jgi:hypothetical protein